MFSIITASKQTQKVSLTFQNFSFSELFNYIAPASLFFYTLGLRLHVGIGCGNVLFMHVGGVCQRLEFIVAGEALVHMSHAEAQSKAGDVCVSSNVWNMIKPFSCGHPTLDAFEAMSDRGPVGSKTGTFKNRKNEIQ